MRDFYIRLHSSYFIRFQSKHRNPAIISLLKTYFATYQVVTSSLAKQVFHNTGKPSPLMYIKTKIRTCRLLVCLLYITLAYSGAISVGKLHEVWQRENKQTVRWYTAPAATSSQLPQPFWLQQELYYLCDNSALAVPYPQLIRTSCFKDFNEFTIAMMHMETSEELLLLRWWARELS